MALTVAALMLGLVVGAAVLTVLALPVHAYGLVMTAPPPLPPPPPPPPDPYTLSATIVIQSVSGRDVAFGESGRIAVPARSSTETFDGRVHVFHPNGTFTKASNIAIARGFERVHVFHPNGTFAFSLDKLLQNVNGIAIGPSDAIAVGANSAVHVFHPNGTFAYQFGSRGSGPSEFAYGPNAIAFGPGGIIAVADAGNHRVQVFHPNGTYAYHFGVEGYYRERSSPVDVAFGPGGIIAVADWGYKSVRVYNPNGTVVDWIGLPERRSVRSVDFGPGGVIAVGGENRKGDHVYIYHPNGTLATTDYYGHDLSDVAFGPFGRLAVAERYRIVVYNITPLTGSIPVEWLPTQAPAPAPAHVPATPNASMPTHAAWSMPLSLTGAAHAFEFGSLGSGAGQFMAARDVAFGPGGVIAVSDTGSHRVQLFHANGTYAFALGVRGEGPGEFYHPEGLAFGPGGLLAVSDMGNSRVQVFRLQ